MRLFGESRSARVTRNLRDLVAGQAKAISAQRRKARSDEKMIEMLNSETRILVELREVDATMLRGFKAHAETQTERATEAQREADAAVDAGANIEKERDNLRRELQEAHAVVQCRDWEIERLKRSRPKKKAAKKAAPKRKPAAKMKARRRAA